MSYKQIELVERVAKYFEAENSYMLKELSNQAVYFSVASLDKTQAKIAVLAYALSKTVSKEHVVKNPVWGKVKGRLLGSLELCISFLRKNKKKQFEKNLERTQVELIHVDSELGNYVRNVWDKAKIKIASNAYAQGLSLSQASELSDANKAEVQNYVGITKIHDEEQTAYSMKQRMKIMRQMFVSEGK